MHDPAPALAPLCVLPRRLRYAVTSSRTTTSHSQQRYDQRPQWPYELLERSKRRSKAQAALTRPHKPHADARRCTRSDCAIACVRAQATRHLASATCAHRASPQSRLAHLCWSIGRSCTSSRESSHHICTPPPSDGPAPHPRMLPRRKLPKPMLLPRRVQREQSSSSLTSSCPWLPPPRTGRQRTMDHRPDRPSTAAAPRQKARQRPRKLEWTDLQHPRYPRPPPP